MVTALFFPSSNRFSSCHCFEHRLSLGTFVLTRVFGAKGCNGSYWHLWGTKTPPKLPSLLRLTWTRSFLYLMFAHRMSWIKDFCVRSKIEQFYPYFCTHKIQLNVAPHTHSGKALVAEAAQGDVNVPHIPKPWSCYRAAPLHPPHSHHPSAFTAGAHLLFHGIPVRGSTLCYWNNCSTASGFFHSGACHLHNCPQGLCLRSVPQLASKYMLSRSRSGTEWHTQALN